MIVVDMDSRAWDIPPLWDKCTFIKLADTSIHTDIELMHLEFSVTGWAVLWSACQPYNQSTASSTTWAAAAALYTIPHLTKSQTINSVSIMTKYVYQVY